MKKDFLNVFHFCSIEVFHSIMKFYTLRLTDIQNSNDLSERVWIENKIQRHVIDKINELRGVTEDEKNLIMIILIMLKKYFKIFLNYMQAVFLKMEIY